MKDKLINILKNADFCELKDRVFDDLTISTEEDFGGGEGSGEEHRTARRVAPAESVAGARGLEAAL